MTCTNIASLPYVVVLSTALLVRTLRPPGARVDTPYGRGWQVSRSALAACAAGSCVGRGGPRSTRTGVLCIERNRTTVGYEITEGGPKDRRRSPPGRHGQRTVKVLREHRRRQPAFRAGSVVRAT